jgi:hypothetical protein
MRRARHGTFFCQGRLSLRAGRAAQREEFEAKRLDAMERAVERGLVQVTNEHGIHAVGFDLEVIERLAAGLTEHTADGDPIPA